MKKIFLILFLIPMILKAQTATPTASNSDELMDDAARYILAYPNPAPYPTQIPLATALPTQSVNVANWPTSVPQNTQIFPYPTKQIVDVGSWPTAVPQNTQLPIQPIQWAATGTITPVPVAQQTGVTVNTGGVSVVGIPTLDHIVLTFVPYIQTADNDIRLFLGPIYEAGSAQDNLVAIKNAVQAPITVVLPTSTFTLSPTPTGSATPTPGNQQVVGNVAGQVADSGNPVKVGGIFNTTAPVLTPGQRGDLQLDSDGCVRVNVPDAIQGGTPVIVGGNTASGATDAGNPVKVGGRFNTVRPTLTNGQRGDLQLAADGDLFVSVHDALPSGGNTLGAVSVVGPLPGQSVTCWGGGPLTIGASTITAALPAGGNILGAVTIVGSLPAGAAALGGVTVLGSLPAGANALGGVTVLGSLPAGSSILGSVTIVGPVPAHAVTVWGGGPVTAGAATIWGGGPVTAGAATITGPLPAGTNLMGGHYIYSAAATATGLHATGWAVSILGSYPMKSCSMAATTTGGSGATTMAVYAWVNPGYAAPTSIGAITITGSSSTGQTFVLNSWPGYQYGVSILGIAASTTISTTVQGTQF